MGWGIDIEDWMNKEPSSEGRVVLRNYVITKKVTFRRLLVYAIQFALDVCR